MNLQTILNPLASINESSHLEEKKDHLIAKIPSLTPEQKQEVIGWFNTHPEQEGKINWNNLKNLQYSDFEPLLKSVSKRAKKNNFKLTGLESLNEGEDFDYVYDDNGITAVVPYNHEASKLIASKYIGDCEGKWCTAYAKTDEYWVSYTGRGYTFIYVINLNPDREWTKLAIAMNPDQGYDEFFDENDRSIRAEDVDKMFPEWKIAYRKAIPLQDNIERQTHSGKIYRELSYSVDVRAINPNQILLDVGAYVEAYATFMDGSIDYETSIDGGSDNAYTVISLYKVGKYSPSLTRKLNLDQVKGFDFTNGYGLAIVYESDRYIDELANNVAYDELGSDDSAYQMKKIIEHFIKIDKPEHQKNLFDYVVVITDNEPRIEDALGNIIEDYTPEISLEFKPDFTSQVQGYSDNGILELGVWYEASLYKGEDDSEPQPEDPDAYLTRPATDYSKQGELFNAFESMIKKISRGF